MKRRMSIVVARELRSNVWRTKKGFINALIRKGMSNKDATELWNKTKLT